MRHIARPLYSFGDEKDEARSKGYEQTSGP